MRNRIVALSLVLSAIGCTTMQTVPPAQFIPSHHPTFVWVYTSDSEATKVLGPRIDGDTLRGTVAGLDEPVTIPLKDIVRTIAKGPDPTRTAVLVAGGIIAGTFVGYAITHASGVSGGSGPCPAGSEAEEC
jgi:hypothetical protein